MHIGIWEILIVGLIIVLLFGKGKISVLMGDLGKGITSFKQGLAGDAKPVDPAPPVPTAPTAAIAPPAVPPPGPKP